MMTDKLREELAAYAHDAWAGWTRYLHSKCVKNAGNLIVPRWFVERMTRQMGTPYADLPEGEKESDRAEADRMIEIFLKHDSLPHDVEHHDKWNKVMKALVAFHERWREDNQPLHSGYIARMPYINIEYAETLVQTYDEWLD